MRNITMLVIHCAATPPSMDIGKAEIEKWHRAKGFFGCGYHYVIRRDGRVEKGRAEDVVGAHALNYNSTSLGICMVGGINEDKGFAESNFTDAQWDTLKELVMDIKQRYKGIKIIGHNEVSTKACPCFNVQKWLKSGMKKATENVT